MELAKTLYQVTFVTSPMCKNCCPAGEKLVGEFYEVPEEYLNYKDPEDKTWYKITPRRFAIINGKWFEVDLRELKSEPFSILERQQQMRERLKSLEEARK